MKLQEFRKINSDWMRRVIGIQATYENWFSSATLTRKIFLKLIISQNTKMTINKKVSSRIL